MKYIIEWEYPTDEGGHEWIVLEGALPTSLHKALIEMEGAVSVQVACRVGMVNQDKGTYRDITEAAMREFGRYWADLTGGEDQLPQWATIEAEEAFNQWNKEFDAEIADLEDLEAEWRANR